MMYRENQEKTLPRRVVGNQTRDILTLTSRRLHALPSCSTFVPASDRSSFQHHPRNLTAGCLLRRCKIKIELGIFSPRPVPHLSIACTLIQARSGASVFTENRGNDRETLERNPSPVSSHLKEPSARRRVFRILSPRRCSV